jgi:hypothetical protein
MGAAWQWRYFIVATDWQYTTQDGKKAVMWRSAHTEYPRKAHVDAWWVVGGGWFAVFPP